MNKARRQFQYIAALLVMSASFVASDVEAQAVPSREELESITRDAERPPTRVSISGGVERSPCPLADPRFSDVKVTLTAVEFNNLKGASANDLAPAWQPFAGEEHPVAILCEIRDAAATILRNQGYLAAVQVPTQRIEDGVVRFETLFARVTAVRARGETQGVERKLEQYLSNLSDGEVFNRFEAERYLLLARDLPGYDVQLTLRPADTGPGDLIGEVAVLRTPIQVELTAQNLAAPETGPFAAQIRAQAFGLTGMGDVTTLAYYATADFSEQHIVQAAHEFRPGGEGLIVGLQTTYAWTRPDIGVSNVALKANTLYASMNALFPLKRTQQSSIWLGSGFDFVDQDVELIVPLSDDRLRVLWVRGAVEAVDTMRSAPRWRANASLEWRQGLDILGARGACGDCGPGRTPPSRIDGKVDASVIRAQGSLEARLSKNVAVAIEPRVQWALDPVLSFEEFTIGNYTVGRGYDPGTVTADSGAGVSTELRGPRLPIGSGNSIRVQPFAFLDYARLWEKNTSFSDDIVSAGGGLRGEITDQMLFSATLAAPLKRAGALNERGDVRLLFTINTRLFPWRRK